MNIEYLGLKEVTGSLVIVQGVKDASYEEMVEITLENGERRAGRVIEIKDDIAVIQVFEGTTGMSSSNTRTRFVGKALEMGLSKELLGRTMDGLGRPIDGLGDIMANVYWDVNGNPINPISRKYPRNYIQTGISAIDGLTTLIRGQKLPVFSGNGLPHDQLAVQIVKQAQLSSDEHKDFAIVFAAMGVKNDVADFFKRSFQESGVLQKVVMFLNLANDPVVERIVTPRCALTTAEYLAFEHNMHVLVILTDMTSYCEALREISSSKGEIPSRKGFPGYMYSDLASLYERAGMLKDREGSITQIPILTMPNDDITHPIPDLTGYITEGQIVLDRGLHQKGVYPPIIVLPSLSRLMKDGIGHGFTRDDHPQIANQLFASYAHVQEVKALASVIGEDELSEMDKRYMTFGRNFEERFVAQTKDENRIMDGTLDIGWELLGLLPREELDRMGEEVLDKYYKPKA
ncbi:MAG: V-type ATP synthase subunit B [Firmicutes bacterium HGW-Firmicutes-1]|jgi:V/A-type H+-transporting ATPase subunit B|nr:MAG: V-type ATP synthase subunit B [Firmicutes bacterium HGW-Firmicutes-1]